MGHGEVVRTERVADKTWGDVAAKLRRLTVDIELVRRQVACIGCRVRCAEAERLVSVL